MNVPNFGPGTGPGVLRSWAQTVEGLGFDLLMEEQQRRAPALAPRIALRLTGSPITDPRRVAGEGTIGQVADDLEQLRLLGADTVVLDPFNGDPRETYHPETAWQALATVSACWAKGTRPI